VGSISPVTRTIRRIQPTTKHGGEKTGGETERTMLEPWTTRISLRTLSSFPLTSFFDMAISMTSRVTSLGTVWAEGLRVAAK